MKKTALWKLLTLTFLLATTLWGTELPWRSDYARALAEAKKAGKNLMIFIEAKHCPYCEKMKQEVLSDPDVVRSVQEGFVPVRLLIDDPIVKREFPKTSVTPTIYFITPKKELLMDVVGYLNQEFFYWRLGAAEEEAERLKRAP